MRIAHFITGLLSGGAEAMLVKVVLRARRFGVEPVVVSLLKGGLQTDCLKAAGVELIELGLRRGWSGIFAPPMILRQGRRVRADLFQGWMYHGNVMASLARMASSAPIPVLWNVRQTLTKRSDEILRTRAVIRFSEFFAQAPQAIIYNAARAASDHERLVGYPASRSVIIGNGFDCDEFRPNPAARAEMRQRWGLGPDTILIGRVARWHAMKDTPTLLDAFGRLAASDPRLTLALVGRGMDHANEDLAGLVARHALNGRVLLCGEQPDMPRVTSAFDVAVSSSSHGEAFPNVLGEAMACGIPAVATDVGASAEILGDANRIAAPSDPASLARALSRVLALSPAERAALGAADRERVRTHFSLDAITESYVRLWRGAVAQGGARPLSGTA